jgi:hypothetical protein
MTEATNHEEVLELLANKKITVDEAMQMLSGAGSPAAGNPATDRTAETIATEIPADTLKVEENETVYVPEVDSLKAAETTSPSGEPLPPMKTAGNHKPNWLQVQVRDLDSGHNRVTVNLPLMMVKFGLNIARRFGAESEEIDLDQLAAQLKDAEPGVLVDVQDEDSNEHVLISLT